MRRYKQRARLGGAQKRQRRGASITELALLAPFLTFMVFGTLEVGRKVMIAQTMTNVAREGARRATIVLGSDAACRTAINNYLAAESITGATTTIVPSSDASLPGTPITVTVSVPYANVAWLTGTARWWPNKQLRGVVTMRKQ